MKGSQLRSVMITLQQTKLYPNRPSAKLFSHKRWKNLIIFASENLKIKYPSKGSLITDLKTIGKAIPQEYLVEATFGIKKFKPEFIQERPLLQTTTVSTMSQSVVQAAKFICQSKKVCDEGFGKHISVTEKTFTEEFNRKYHPLRFMLKNIRNLLELKYKSLVDNNKICLAKLQGSLKQDLQICIQFLAFTSQPYKQLFKCKNDEQSKTLSNKFDKFFDLYLMNHPKVLLTCHRILLYSSRHQYDAKLNQCLPENCQITQYQIPEDFQIAGCYIRSMSSLMEFASYNSSMTPQKILSKLIEFRQNILNDIDCFYLEKDGEAKQLELNAEIQIQIIRFIISKLKGWACQIFAQLKFLEHYFGDQDIAYKYEQASFIYVQLTMGFEILGIQ